MNKYAFLWFVSLMACGEVQNNFELPILGRPEIIERVENGETYYDTLTHKIDSFQLVNQDSTLVSNNSLKGNVYVADFFFTSCPTICPTMKQQMLRVYDRFQDSSNFLLVSHTIDPEYDTVALLKDYSNRLGVETSKWVFLTGDKDHIYELAESSYMVVAADEPDAPGGYIHSGAFILVDKDQQIRGVYDGTVQEQVDLLMKDINWLLNSYSEI